MAITSLIAPATKLIGKFVKNPIYENTLSYHTITIKNNDELVNDISDFVVNFFEK